MVWAGRPRLASTEERNANLGTGRGQGLVVFVHLNMEESAIGQIPTGVSSRLELDDGSIAQGQAPTYLILQEQITLAGMEAARGGSSTHQQVPGKVVRKGTIRTNGIGAGTRMR